jgi:hypothetical protein
MVNLTVKARVVTGSATIVHLIGLACPLWTKSGETYNGLWAMCYKKHIITMLFIMKQYIFPHFVIRRI